MFQMSKSLNLTIVLAVGCILVGCAEQSVIQKPMAAVATANSHLGRVPNVRTTAYTRVEKGGHRNALGAYLSGHRVMSAASDWSRFPLGTRFRIANTKDEYIIDLYKPTKLEMKRWGVRNVDIDILQWGSEEQSLKVLSPRAKHQTARRMIAGLRKKAPSSRTGVASTSAQASTRASAGRTLD